MMLSFVKSKKETKRSLSSKPCTEAINTYLYTVNDDSKFFQKIMHTLLEKSQPSIKHFKEITTLALNYKTNETKNTQKYTLLINLLNYNRSSIVKRNLIHSMQDLKKEKYWKFKKREV